MSDGAVVGIVIGALVVVGLVIGLVFALVAGNDGPETAGATDTSEPDNATTDTSEPAAASTDTAEPDTAEPDAAEPGAAGTTDTSAPDGSPTISSVAVEEDIFRDADGFTFVQLSPDDLATAKREFLAADQFLEVAVEEIAVREVERDGTSVGAAFAVSLDEVLALAPVSEESFLEGAKEGLGGGGEDLVLAGHPAFYGETAGLPFVVSLKNGIFLFVVGEDRSTCEQVMTELLGNIT